MNAVLDIAIQTPYFPGPIEAILGELKQLRESNALLEKRQTEIEAELSLAARVQDSLAPRRLVWNGVAVETHYSPAHTIGGDFGIVFPHNDEALTNDRLVRCNGTRHKLSADGQPHLL